MALGSERLRPHFEEVAARLVSDGAPADVQVTGGKGQSVQLEGKVDGLDVVYQFIGGGEDGGSWQISVQGTAPEFISGLSRASVAEKGRRWIEKKAKDGRIIPTRARGNDAAAFVVGSGLSVLFVAADSQETIARMVDSGVADNLLAVPPPAQYWASGRLDAQLPIRWVGQHPAEFVSERIRAYVAAVKAIGA